MILEKWNKHLFPDTFSNTYKAALTKIDNYLVNDKNWDFAHKETPNIYEIGKNSTIHYFGTSHVRNIEDPIVSKLREDFHNYANKVNRNVICLIEDWELCKFDSEKTACSEKGEQGLLTYWGTQMKVKVIPTDYNHQWAQHLNILSQDHTAENMVLFIYLYFVKARKWSKLKYLTDASAYTEQKVNEYLDRLQSQKINYEELNKIFAQKFNQTIKERLNTSSWEDLNIRKKNNGVNTIFKDYHMLRDGNFYIRWSQNLNKVTMCFACLVGIMHNFMNQFLGKS